MNRIEKKIPAAAPIDAPIANTDIGSDLSGEFESVGGRVSEIAGEEIDDGQSGGASTATPTSDDDLANEKISLRETLLASAPAENEMRRQIIERLGHKKSALEKQLSGVDATDYNLFEDTLRELRKIIRSMQHATMATLDVLKEIWLSVVHNFT